MPAQPCFRAEAEKPEALTWHSTDTHAHRAHSVKRRESVLAAPPLCATHVRWMRSQRAMSESGSVWAVIVGSSQYWHNYRHVSNALTMYDAVRSLGVPDSQIVLMLAGDTPCDARNVAPGRVVNARLDGPNLYRPDIEVDYRGAEVTAEAFLRVLTDTLPADTPASRRLGSGAGSRVLVYLAGP